MEIKDRVAECRSDDELMNSLRLRPMYTELEAGIKTVIEKEDLISTIETEKMPHLLTLMDTEEKKKEYCEELQFQMTAEFIKRIVDKDHLESEEMVFLMVMIEDIVKTIARAYVYNLNC